MTPVQLAAQELLRRRKARRGLLDFICYINPEYIVSEFAQELCGAIEQFLEDQRAGKRPVLVVQAPPQHGKSDIVSRYAPAWLFGQNPDLSIGGLSYAKDLASDMNRDVQRIMLSPEYGRLFPDASLSAKRAVHVDMESKRNSDVFEIVNRKGRYIGAGVGGPLTGKRLDCLVAGTMVSTSIGDICIEDLPMHANTCKILTYNGKGLSYGHIKAFASSQGSGIYRVTTQSGRVFESTGDHKVFTGSGWIGASELATGDLLVCGVRDISYSHGGGLPEDDREGRQLRPVLLNQVRGICDAESQTDEVRGVRGEIPGSRKEVLLQGLHADQAPKESANPEDMRNVHDGLSVEVAGRELSSLLRETVRGSRSRQANDGRGESSLSGWSQSTTPATAFSEGVPNNQADGVGSRQSCLRIVQQEGLQTGGPSYGRMVEQQRVIEFSDALRDLSQSCPQADGFREVRDHVASVELVRESATVYDIQVEGDHNFFANGVLVHNCGIIDDPIKNAQEALSQVTKDSVWNWYITTFATRLSKNSGQIIMATSWATDDLSGRVIAATPRAKVLKFVAVNMPGEKGYDANRRQGALVPELHPLDKLLETKALMSDYFWSAMYQQSPIALGGNMFKTDGFKLWRGVPPKLKWRAVYADTAQKTKEHNDYSVFQCWGESWEGQAVMLDQIRGKWEAPELLTQAKAFWAKHKIGGEGLGVLRSFNVEDKASGTGLIQSMIGIPVVGIPRSVDKITRAMDAIPLIQSGNVLLPEDAPWLSDYLSEFAAFPKGTHDDQIDPTMDAIADILSPQKIDYRGLL